MLAQATSHKSRIITTIIFAMMAALFGFLLAKVWQGTSSVFISGRNPVSQLASLVFDGNRLAGESRGQVNILLLGVGGPGHDGPYLSDTIMIASVKPNTNEVSLISIPRDTMVAIPGSAGQYKINSAYAYAITQRDEKYALKQARETVGNYLGLEIPYVVVVDFAGFAKAVDTLGGLDVEIEKSFTDYYFPDTRYRYLSPVSFAAGVEHMDGERALIYARSRYSTSDYDRAARQQKILEAAKSRIKDLNFFRDITTISKLFDDFTGHVSTNMTVGEIKRLADLATNTPQNKIYSTVLDPSTGLVCSYISTEKGFHLNLCPGKTEKDLQKYAESSFARGHVRFENPNVEIQNATTVTGQALTAAEQIKSLGFSAATTNAGKLSDPSQTYIYDLTDGKKPDSLAVLLVTFSGKVGKTPPVYKGSRQPDFIVALGSNYKPPFLDVINLDPPKPKEEPIDEKPAEEENTDENTAQPKTPTDTTTQPKDKDKLLDNSASPTPGSSTTANPNISSATNL